MITEWYRNPKKPVVKPHYSYDENQAFKLNLTLDEYKRRQKIIQDLCIDASREGIYVGAKLWPKDEKYALEYGEVRVIAVARTVGDLGTSTWPASDVPLLVHASPLNGGQGFFGTVSFFSKEQPKFEIDQGEQVE